jgi:hypothetical protein
MNYDSYERFRFTDPRDDLDRLGIDYDLYTEINIGSFFDKIGGYSCVLIASNALHHPSIHHAFAEHENHVHDSIRHGLGLVILHQASETDYRGILSIFPETRMLDEHTLHAEIARDHSILHVPHDLDKTDYALTKHVFPSYYLYYHSFPELIEGFEGVLANEHGHFVLILGTIGRGRVVISTGTYDWYGRSDRLLHNLLVWAGRSGDVVVYTSEFRDFMRYALEGVDYSLVSSVHEIANPRILIVDSKGAVPHNPSTVLLEIGDERVSLHSDNAIVTRNRLINELESMQLSDGSWENSQWKTAEAMRALYDATNDVRLGSIQKGFDFLHSTAKTADSPTVLSGIAPAVDIFSRAGNPGAEILRRRIVKVFEEAKLDDFDYFTQIRIMRNLLQTMDSSRLSTLFTDTVERLDLGELPLRALTEILFTAEALGMNKMASKIKDRALDLLGKSGLPSDEYESMEILILLLALRIEHETCLKKLIQSVFTKATKVRPSYASALTLESFSTAMKIPYYQKWLTRMELVFLTVKGSLLISEWYNLEPSFNSLYAELEKEKNEISRLKNSLASLERKEKAERKDFDLLKRKMDTVLFSVTRRTAEILGVAAAIATVVALLYEIIRMLT